jgi:formate dehydrogenase iron-sulfur subunit
MKGMLIDTTRCIGCRGCQVACKQWNGLEAEETAFFSGDDYQNPRDLSPRTWTVVTYNEVLEEDEFRWVCGKVQCMHCNSPACVASCPTGAMHKTEEGPVAYDRRLCLGCRYCMLACPFQVIRFDWYRANPYISKCTMCVDRVANGQEPACAKACPTDAITFGERDDLIAEAHSRIRQSPRQYVHHVYGENEVGGTSILQLSSVPFSVLGYRSDLPDKPLVEFTRPAMEQVPFVVAGLSLILGGVAWVANRREERAREKSEPNKGESA